MPEGAKNATLKCKEFDALGINVECTLRGKEWVEYDHELGLITSFWTVDKEEDMQEVISWGTDLITTNKPDTLSKVLEGVRKF